MGKNGVFRLVLALLFSVVSLSSFAFSEVPTPTPTVTPLSGIGLESNPAPNPPSEATATTDAESDTEPKAGAAPPSDDAEAGASAVEERQTLECQNGMAGPFPCENIDLESALPLAGAGVGTGNDVWGWTDPESGNEYAIVGSALATTFIDITDPQNPTTVGILPTAMDAPPDFVLWRDIKVDGNWAYVVSEISGHGMQVFDLTRLRDPAPVPQIFTADALYRGADEEGLELGNAHNIAINEETDFAYLVGSNTCVSPGAEGQNGGLHMVDISDPVNPEFAGCALVTDPERHNYSHDVQCVIYRGPDADYRGREICFGSNEEVVVIYDVTNKDNPVVISQWGYPEASYTHQGWLTEDQRYFLFGDEGDETAGTVDNTTTYVMDAQDLDRPKKPTPFFHETRSIDHNLYIQDNLVYQANYGAGLRILEFSNSSLSNGQLNEVGFFDIRPGFDEPEFVGAWSTYPYYESGTVVLSVVEEGSAVLYVLKPTGEAAGEVGSGGNGNGNGNGNGGGGSGGNGGGNNNGGGGSGGNEGPEQRDPTSVGSEGAALGVTGSEMLIFLMLGLGLITSGVIIQKIRSPRDDTSTG